MNLNDDFHEVFLGDHVFAVYDLLHNTWQDCVFIQRQVNSVQLGEPNKICADEDAEFSSFQLAFLPIARVPLMLETHPELVHLDKVRDDESNRVVQIASWTGLKK
jgi:hypothetical protein